MSFSAILWAGNSAAIMTPCPASMTTVGSPLLSPDAAMGIAACQKCDQQTQKKVEPAKICRHTIFLRQTRRAIGKFRVPLVREVCAGVSIIAAAD